jgi:REP-associated tyrosine transposase
MSDDSLFTSRPATAVGHRCDSMELAGLNRQGIVAGEQCVIVGLSVRFHNVWGMLERRFRRTLGGVCALGLHVVWRPNCRRRILGRLAEQIAAEDGSQILAKEVMPDHVHLVARCGSHRRVGVCGAGIHGPPSARDTKGVPHLRCFPKVLWSRSHVASVGDESRSTERRYIEHPWDAVAS